MFRWLLVVIMIGSLTSIGSIVSRPLCPDHPEAKGVLELCLNLYFIVHNMLAPLFFVYILYVTGGIHIWKKKKNLLMFVAIPLIVDQILTITNPLTDWVYFTGADYSFNRNWAEGILYIVAAFYFFLTIVQTVKYWQGLSRRNRFALCFMFGITLLGILVQMLNKYLAVELFAESVAVLGIMLTIENEDNRIDTYTNLYNRNALERDTANLIFLKQKFYVIIVRISNSDSLQKMSGASTSDVLMNLVAEYLCGIHHRYEIFKMSTSTFLLLLHDRSKEETMAMAETIRKRFDENWSFAGGDIHLNAVVMVSSHPEELKNTVDIFRLTDSPEPPDAYGRILSGDGLAYLSRSIELEQALNRGLSEHNFEVYYQPTYDLETMDIHSAEALIRLHDPILGWVPPTEFIPVAERNGMIDEISKFVLEETCLFLSSGLPVEMGIESISVNLSVLQCLQPSFATFAKELVHRYDISASLINFEIKESAAVSDFSVLEKVLKEMRSYGFRFSMDSYGTGFSDMRSIFSLDLDTIKIDRSVLQNAGENEIGHIILDNCVRTIHEMHRKCLVEGVETQEQLEMLKLLGADYVQGYFSSKPITRNELLGILRFTELARMEERRAIAASEAKSSFLANMSHEIRTPINAVLGMNEMILRECREPHVMEYAEEIEIAGRNLLSLINNILDYSKIEAGDMEIVEAKYDFGKALGEVVTAFDKKFKAKELQFEVHISPEIPCMMYGDEFRLKQILTNLLNNAIKFTAEGGVSMSVYMEQAMEEEVLLTFVISDSGCGIKEEDLGKLFQRFERLNTDKNLTIEGGGLGLAISYSLLQMMGGEIKAESVYGLGSTFTVNILQKALGEETIGDFRSRYMVANESSGADYQESFTAPEAHVLVVDDTPLNHVVVKELLKKTEVHIDSASSGSEGIRMASKRHYDLILLDERMPGLTGQETLKVIRREEGPSRHTPVISMTANDRSGAREEFRSYGYEDYLSKPVESERLEEMLRRYLPDSKIFLKKGRR